jgi:signal transduction histidine kinase
MSTLHEFHKKQFASLLRTNAMTLASDQNIDDGKLSPTSQKMLELRDVVFAEWEKEVRSSIKEAVALPHPVLLNTFPILYDNIAEALTERYPRTSAGTAVTSVGLEHGSERARLSSYDPGAIISEYQLLRSTILRVLQQNQVALDARESLFLNSSVDAAIKDAVNAFVLAQSAFREQFVASLAHDLRNPLATATIAAELILHTTDLRKINIFARQIVDNNKRMDQMIRDLLDTVIFQNGERIPLQASQFDMLEVAKEVCEQSRVIHGDRIQTLGGPVHGWWEREAIKRALENLVGNAAKYGDTDKPIRVKVDCSHERVMISIHNEGDPIPAEQTESIFQVFRRARAAKEGKEQGWGIGLPYARSVAESHGGSIGVDSTKERGTTFMLDMPIDSRPFQNSPMLEKGH